MANIKIYKNYLKIKNKKFFIMSEIFLSIYNKIFLFKKL